MDGTITVKFTRAELQAAIDDIWNERGPSAEDLPYVRKMQEALVAACPPAGGTGGRATS